MSGIKPPELPSDTPEYLKDFVDYFMARIDALERSLTGLSNQTNVEFNQTNIKSNQNNVESNQINVQTNGTNFGFNRANVESIRISVEANQTNVKSYETKVESNRTKVECNKIKVEYNREKIRAEVHTMLVDMHSYLRNLFALRLLSDPCEIKISGIPATLTITDQEIGDRVLVAIGLPQIPKFVMILRQWAPPPKPKGTRTILLMLMSSTIRDMVIENTAKLKNLDASKIFGEGGTGKIHITAIWPKPIYHLLKAATVASESKGFARPVVINLTVCLRKTARSDKIPVFSVEGINRALNAALLTDP